MFARVKKIKFIENSVTSVTLSHASSIKYHPLPFKVSSDGLQSIIR